MDLYSYVGNDPVNNKDPSGLKCEGSGDNSSCTIERAKIDGKWTKLDTKTREGLAKSDAGLSKAIGKLEGNLRSAYMAAQKAGANQATIKGVGDVKDVKISGNAVASIFQKTEFRLSGEAGPSGENASTLANGSAEPLLSGLTTFYKASDDSDFAQQRRGIHEMMHLSPLTGGWNKYDYDQQIHQPSFRDGAEEMLRLGQ